MKFTAVKENHLYSKAYSKGKKFVTPTVIVYVMRDFSAGRIANARPDKKRVNRIGITVSKKLGGAPLNATEQSALSARRTDR